MVNRRDMSQAPYDRRPGQGYDNRGQTPAADRGDFMPEGTPGVLTPRGTHFVATRAATPFVKGDDRNEWSNGKKFFLVFFRAQTYKSIVYPLLSFIFDVLNFASVILGFGLSVPLFFITIGFPIFALFIKLWRASGLLQRWLAVHMTGRHPVYKFNNPNIDHAAAVRHQRPANDLESGSASASGSWVSTEEDSGSYWTEDSYEDDGGGWWNKNKGAAAAALKKGKALKGKKGKGAGKTGKKKARFADSESDSYISDSDDSFEDSDSDEYDEYDEYSDDDDDESSLEYDETTSRGNANGTSSDWSESLPPQGRGQSMSRAASEPHKHRPSKNFFVGIWESFKHDYRDPFTWRSIGTFIVKFIPAVVLLALNLFLVLFPIYLIFFALLREVCLADCVARPLVELGLDSVEFPLDSLLGNLAVLLPVGLILLFLFLNLNNVLVYGMGSLMLKMLGHPRSKAYLEEEREFVWVPMAERDVSRAPSNFAHVRYSTRDAYSASASAATTTEESS